MAEQNTTRYIYNGIISSALCKKDDHGELVFSDGIRDSIQNTRMGDKILGALNNLHSYLIETRQINSNNIHEINAQIYQKYKACQNMLLSYSNMLNKIYINQKHELEELNKKISNLEKF